MINKILELQKKVENVRTLDYEEKCQVILMMQYYF